MSSSLFFHSTVLLYSHSFNRIFMENATSFVCPECKNTNEDIDLIVGNIVECEFCGITLEVSNINEQGQGDMEIVDEGK